MSAKWFGLAVVVVVVAAFRVVVVIVVVVGVVVAVTRTVGCLVEWNLAKCSYTGLSGAFLLPMKEHSVQPHSTLAAG